MLRGEERRQLLSSEVSKELKTSSKVLPHPECNVALRQEVGKGSHDHSRAISCRTEHGFYVSGGVCACVCFSFYDLLCV